MKAILLLLVVQLDNFYLQASFAVRAEDCDGEPQDYWKQRLAVNGEEESSSLLGCPLQKAFILLLPMQLLANCIEYKYVHDIGKLLKDYEGQEIGNSVFKRGM